MRRPARPRSTPSKRLPRNRGEWSVNYRALMVIDSLMMWLPSWAVRQSLARSVRAYNEHRAVGVPDHRLRNTAHQGSLQGAQTSATDHDRPYAQLLAQLHDLLIRLSRPEVGLRYLPSR